MAASSSTNVTSSANSAPTPTAGNWDQFVKNATNQYGASAISKSGPASGTAFYAEQQRRNLEQDIGYRQNSMEGKRRMEENLRMGRPLGASQDWSPRPVFNGLYNL